MNKLMLAMLLILSCAAHAEKIEGDTNHDGVLSGEEQYFRNHPTQPPPPPPPPPTKHVDRTDSIKIPFGSEDAPKGWMGLAKGQPMPPDVIQRLQDEVNFVHDPVKRAEIETKTLMKKEMEERKAIMDARRAKEEILWTIRLDGLSAMPKADAGQKAEDMLMEMMRQDTGYQPNSRSPSTPYNQYSPRTLQSDYVPPNLIK